MATIHRITRIYIMFAAAMLAAGCGFVYQRPAAEQEPRSAPTALPASQHELLPFGNPSNATTDPANADNYLIVRDSAVTSYNDSRGTANWVAWRTRRSDLGESIPRSMFEPDPALPRGFRRIGYYDYSGSGYDRGHLLPSADRFGSREQNAETFYLSNIVPQAGDLNQFPWNDLESYARSLVRRGSQTYTIAGVYGEQLRIKGKLTAPTNCWKVIVVFPSGQSVDTITNITRIIAVDMPNVEGIADEKWQKYRTTVRAIEQKAGIDLFSALPRELQDRIETRADGN
ncbi:MAG: DNA/RNA non-specific endonuclease [Pyrinomonadaceae bacterium]|nr:DNA/RNA non-specific endonuclease [Pyrinomonadaceae bacterium]